MVTAHYERLSAQDSSFLVFEGPNTHMHVGGTAIFEVGPLAAPGGGVDIERIRAYVASRLHWLPRYRQRIAYVPVENAPVWVDDAHFNLNYHVRHASLPRPGNERQLKRLCGRIMSQQLDRGKPLWELWFVEGLEGGRFAMVNKSHHCMVDGISGVDLVSILLSATPDTAIDEAPRWEARPAPSRAELLRDALVRRASVPLEIARSVRGLIEAPERAREELTDRLRAIWQLASTGLRPVADTPLNRPIGPHRRLDWLSLDLAEVKEVKNRLGGSVNDVVLTTVAGALRTFLQRRGTNVDSLDYRVVVPVSVRAAQEQGSMGNRVSAWMTSLPLQHRDPRKRFAKVRQITARLKASKQALAADALTQVGEWAGSGLLTLGVRLTTRLHPYNLIVTNIPGPQLPLYLLGAGMLVGYPVVPLFENQGLGIALLSYGGKLCWGLNADFDLMTDLEEFLEAIAQSFRELHAVALKHGPKAARAARVQKPRLRRAG